MKKGLLIVTGVLVLASLLLVACSAGVSQADFNSLKSDLAAAKTQLTKTQSDLAAAKADLEKAKVDLSDQQMNQLFRLAEVKAGVAANKDLIVQAGKDIVTLQKQVTALTPPKPTATPTPTTPAK